MIGKREVTDYLHDILDAAESAEEFVAGMEFDAFAADRKTVFAVIRALEIIGEAAKDPRCAAASLLRRALARHRRYAG